MAQGAAKGYAQPYSEPVVPSAAKPTRFAFADLQKANSYDYLEWELKQQESIHLDVNVKYNARSLNRLIETFHRNGVRLTVTPPAQASLAKNQPVLVYAENVPADKLAKALRELSEVDIQGNNRQPSTFDALHVSPGGIEDVFKLSRGLGMDFRKIKPPASPTNGDLAPGIVVGPQSTAIPPREVQEFLSARRPTQPGTLQVYVQLLPKS